MFLCLKSLFLLLVIPSLFVDGGSNLPESFSEVGSLAGNLRDAFSGVISAIGGTSSVLSNVKLPASSGKGRLCVPADDKKAFVTVYTGEPEQLWNVRVLIQSIHENGGSADIVVMLPAAHAADRAVRQTLISEGITTFVIPTSLPSSMSVLTAAKISAWALTKYDRVIFLEPNTLVLKNSDALFACDGLCLRKDFAHSKHVDRDSVSTSSQIDSLRIAQPPVVASIETEQALTDLTLSYFSSSVMVLEPSKQLFSSMQQSLVALSRSDSKNHLEEAMMMESEEEIIKSKEAKSFSQTIESQIVSTLFANGRKHYGIKPRKQTHRHVVKKSPHSQKEALEVMDMSDLDVVKFLFNFFPLTQCADFGPAEVMRPPLRSSTLGSSSSSSSSSVGGGSSSSGGKGPSDKVGEQANMFENTPFSSSRTAMSGRISNVLSNMGAASKTPRSLLESTIDAEEAQLNVDSGDVDGDDDSGGGRGGSDKSSMKTFEMATVDSQHKHNMTDSSVHHIRKTLGVVASSPSSSFKLSNGAASSELRMPSNLYVKVSNPSALPKCTADDFPSEMAQRLINGNQIPFIPMQGYAASFPHSPSTSEDEQQQQPIQTWLQVCNMIPYTYNAPAEDFQRTGRWASRSSSIHGLNTYSSTSLSQSLSEPNVIRFDPVTDRPWDALQYRSNPIYWKWDHFRSFLRNPYGESTDIWVLWVLIMVPFMILSCCSLTIHKNDVKYLLKMSEEVAKFKARRRKIRQPEAIAYNNTSFDNNQVCLDFDVKPKKLILNEYSNQGSELYITRRNDVCSTKEETCPDIPLPLSLSTSLIGSEDNQYTKFEDMGGNTSSSSSTCDGSFDHRLSNQAPEKRSKKELNQPRKANNRKSGPSSSLLARCWEKVPPLVNVSLDLLTCLFAFVFGWCWFALCFSASLRLVHIIWHPIAVILIYESWLCILLVSVFPVLDLCFTPLNQCSVILEHDWLTRHLQFVHDLEEEGITDPSHQSTTSSGNASSASSYSSFSILKSKLCKYEKGSDEIPNEREDVKQQSVKSNKSFRNIKLNHQCIKSVIQVCQRCLVLIILILLVRGIAVMLSLVTADSHNISHTSSSSSTTDQSKKSPVVYPGAGPDWLAPWCGPILLAIIVMTAWSNGFIAESIFGPPSSHKLKDTTKTNNRVHSYDNLGSSLLLTLSKPTTFSSTVPPAISPKAFYSSLHINRSFYFKLLVFICAIFCMINLSIICWMDSTSADLKEQSFDTGIVAHRFVFSLFVVILTLPRKLKLFIESCLAQMYVSLCSCLYLSWCGTSYLSAGGKAKGKDNAPLLNGNSCCLASSSSQSNDLDDDEIELGGIKDISSRSSFLNLNDQALPPSNHVHYRLDTANEKWRLIRIVIGRLIIASVFFLLGSGVFSFLIHEFPFQFPSQCFHQQKRGYLSWDTSKLAATCGEKQSFKIHYTNNYQEAFKQFKICLEADMDITISSPNNLPFTDTTSTSASSGNQASVSTVVPPSPPSSPLPPMSGSSDTLLDAKNNRYLTTDRKLQKTCETNNQFVLQPLDPSLGGHVYCIYNPSSGSYVTSRNVAVPPHQCKDAERFVITGKVHVNEVFTWLLYILPRFVQPTFLINGPAAAMNAYVLLVVWEYRRLTSLPSGMNKQGVVWWSEAVSAVCWFCVSLHLLCLVCHGNEQFVFGTQAFVVEASQHWKTLLNFEVLIFGNSMSNFTSYLQSWMLGSTAYAPLQLCNGMFLLQFFASFPMVVIMLLHACSSAVKGGKTFGVKVSKEKYQRLKVSACLIHLITALSCSSWPVGRPQAVGIGVSCPDVSSCWWSSVYLNSAFHSAAYDNSEVVKNTLSTSSSLVNDFRLGDRASDLKPSPLSKRESKRKSKKDNKIQILSSSSSSSSPPPPPVSTQAGALPQQPLLSAIKGFWSSQECLDTLGYWTPNLYATYSVQLFLFYYQFASGSFKPLIKAFSCIYFSMMIFLTIALELESITTWMLAFVVVFMSKLLASTSNSFITKCCCPWAIPLANTVKQAVWHSRYSFSKAPTKKLQTQHHHLVSSMSRSTSVPNQIVPHRLDGPFIKDSGPSELDASMTADDAQLLRKPSLLSRSASGGSAKFGSGRTSGRTLSGGGAVLGVFRESFNDLLSLALDGELDNDQGDISNVNGVKEGGGGMLKSRSLVSSFPRAGTIAPLPSPTIVSESDSHGFDGHETNRFNRSRIRQFNHLNPSFERRKSSFYAAHAIRKGSDDFIGSEDLGSGSGSFNEGDDYFDHHHLLLQQQQEEGGRGYYDSTSSGLLNHQDSDTSDDMRYYCNNDGQDCLDNASLMFGNEPENDRDSLSSSNQFSTPYNLPLNYQVAQDFIIHPKEEEMNLRSPSAMNSNGSNLQFRRVSSELNVPGEGL